MATDEKRVVGKGIPKAAIKQEADWLLEEMHVVDDLQEFVKALNPLKSIKSEVELPHVDAETEADQQTPNGVYECTKIELTLDNKFLEEINDFYSTVSAKEYEPLVLERADVHQPRASTADEDSEHSYSKESIEIPNDFTNTEFKMEEEFFDHNFYTDSTSYPHEDNQCVLETADNQQATGIQTDNSETNILSHNSCPKVSIETHITQAQCGQTYQCEFCPLSFEDQIDLTHHSRIHDDNVPRNYACGRCSFRCLDINSLKSHLKTHAKELRGELPCHLCDKRFNSPRGLSIHLRLHTGDTYNCEICGMRSSLKANLKKHMLRWHSDETSSKIQRYKCKECDKDYGNRYSLFEHSKEHTGSPWKCTICEKKFTQKNSCRAHISKLHKIVKEAINEFICHITPSKESSIYMKASQFKTNEVQVTQTANNIAECIKTELLLDEEFLDDKHGSDSDSNARDKQQRTLEIESEEQSGVSVTDYDTETCKLGHNIYPKALMDAHVSVERCAERYQCEFCQQTFKTQKSLLLHSHVHDVHRARNYACGQCGWKCFYKNTLERHLLTHSNDRKKFACSLCEKVFKCEGTLLVHMRLHTGDTHNCELCGARFPTKRRLETHILSCKSGETFSSKQRYKCKLCDKTYASVYLLSVHCKEHTGLPWKCSICAKEFAEKTRCRKHVIRVHKITDKESLNEHVLKNLTAKDL